MFGWLFSSTKTHIFPDHYAVTQKTLDESICEAALAQVSQGDLVILLAHFPGTFQQTQELLEQKRIDYHLITGPIDWSSHFSKIRGELSQINLCLVETFLQSSVGSATANNRLADANELKISAIIVERHPLYSVDQKLQNKLRQIPRPIQAGYYLSFEQPVLEPIVNEGMRMLMKQFGMGDRNLVTSELISRRIKQRLRRFERMATMTESGTGALNRRPNSSTLVPKPVDWQPADSAREWLELNGTP